MRILERGGEGVLAVRHGVQEEPAGLVRAVVGQDVAVGAEGGGGGGGADAVQVGGHAAFQARVHGFRRAVGADRGAEIDQGARRRAAQVVDQAGELRREAGVVQGQLQGTGEDPGGVVGLHAAGHGLAVAALEGGLGPGPRCEPHLALDRAAADHGHRALAVAEAAVGQLLPGAAKPQDQDLVGLGPVEGAAHGEVDPHLGHDFAGAGPVEGERGGHVADVLAQIDVNGPERAGAPGRVQGQFEHAPGGDPGPPVAAVAVQAVLAHGAVLAFPLAGQEGHVPGDGVLPHRLGPLAFELFLARVAAGGQGEHQAGGREPGGAPVGVGASPGRRDAAGARGAPVAGVPHVPASRSPGPAFRVPLAQSTSLPCPGKPPCRRDRGKMKWPGLRISPVPR